MEINIKLKNERVCKVLFEFVVLDNQVYLGLILFISLINLYLNVTINRLQTESLANG